MSTNDSRSRTRRIETLEIGNGDLVIYDAENTRAWIQSDGTIDPGEMA